MAGGLPGSKDSSMAIQGLAAAVESLVAWPQPGRVRVGPRAWLYFLGAGFGLAIAAALASDAKAIQLLLAAAGLATTGAILLGVRTHRPARLLPWRLLALCTLVTTFGTFLAPIGGVLAVVGQSATVAGSVAGLVGFVLLIRGRIPGGDRPALLDAAILASGTGVLIWAFGFAPYAVAARQSSIVPAAMFYPTIIAFAMVVRLWFLPGAHRPATRLIVLLVVAANAIIFIDVLRGIGSGAPGSGALAGAAQFAGFAELAFMGAAALHPSMAIAPEHKPAGLQPISRRRLLALTAALLVNPATLAIEGMGDHRIDPAPYIVGGVLIALLVIARLGDALRELGESLGERESLMGQLRHQASYDDLTSLPNRSFFNDRLEFDFANRSVDRPPAVLLIDLDEFKAVNDRYGHGAGDNLLIAVGQRLRAAIRADDMAARLGGDEFVITLQECPDLRFAIQVAQRVIATLGTPFDIGGHSVTVRVSVGVAVAGDEDRTADDLVRKADIAMYSAKSHGKGRFEVFDPSMHLAGLIQLQAGANAGIPSASDEVNTDRSFGGGPASKPNHPPRSERPMAPAHQRALHAPQPQLGGRIDLVDQPTG
jgi:diguanylate cyclase (GGDEF)-like protein